MIDRRILVAENGNGNWIPWNEIAVGDKIVALKIQHSNNSENNRDGYIVGSKGYYSINPNIISSSSSSTYRFSMSGNYNGVCMVVFVFDQEAMSTSELTLAPATTGDSFDGKYWLYTIDSIAKFYGISHSSSIGKNPAPVTNVTESYYEPLDVTDQILCLIE